MKRITTLFMAILLGTGFMYSATEKTDTCSSLAQTDKHILNHLDLGVSVGSTGVGLDLALPLTHWARVRAGVSYMPQFKIPMHFGLESYSNTGTSTFDKAQELIGSAFGYTIDEEVKVVSTPKMLTFNLLFDIYPFKNNKHWYFTVGAHIGSSHVATAKNDIGEMTTLVPVGMFNSMYDFVAEGRYWDEPIYGDFFLDPAVAEKFLSLGRVGVGLGTFTHTMYQDNETKKYVKEPLPGRNYTEHKAGDRYIMYPDADATVSTRAFVNVFRPYLGLGYNGHIDRAKRFSIGVDCGIMFWGGAPRIVTHEGVDLVRDVEGIKGNVGDYVDIAGSLKVYPVLNARIGIKLF